jgi:hypothetical protein
MRTHLDHPVCSTLWLPVPDSATPDYREPLWRGTPDFVDYSPNSQTQPRIAAHEVNKVIKKHKQKV